VIESIPLTVRSQWPSRWRLGARFAMRSGLRAVVESLYLLTAPVSAAVGVVLVFGGLCAGTMVSLLPGRSRLAAGISSSLLAPARWFADLERWRIAKLRSLTALTARMALTARTARMALTTSDGTKVIERAEGAGRPSPADPELWLDAAHAAVLFPVAFITAVITGIWWVVAITAGTSALLSAGQFTVTGSLPPMTLLLVSAHSHIALSLALVTVARRLAFGTVLGLVALLTLPAVTRVCVAVQAGLGQALLSEASVLHRRIRGLERERDAARGQTIAAVSAEATALRRLERDIHDGPQQRLVRLALELGRAQHNFDTRPEAVRDALAEALVQTQEALEELRALSRGIAPPILVDRGLREAISALAARSTVPVELDLAPMERDAWPDRRPDAALETAAYFAVAEALTNVAKHSYASRCVVGLRHDEGTLRAWVTDDGVGGAELAKGHGLRGLDDRLHSVGGHLRVTSPAGGPTTISAVLPCS
jgi:signal transduction histidine kinase